MVTEKTCLDAVLIKDAITSTAVVGVFCFGQVKHTHISMSNMFCSQHAKDDRIVL